jgi:multiple sugar transport system ATP-binding protein
LRLAGQPKATISAKVDAAAQSLGLTELLDRLPRQLSGGQRQRVAMGRAMVRAPAVFLFDEPLSNLDASLRSSVRAEIRAMHARSKTTSVYVTHDQTEAMTLGDRIVVLRNGAVEQSGTPQALYQAPVNRFVASFIGTPAMNFLPGHLAPDTQGQLTFTNASGQVQLPVSGHSVQAGACTLGMRPEHGALAAAGAVALAGAFALSCQVQSLEFTGADTFVTVHTSVGSMLVKCDDRAHWRAGDAATLLCRMDRLHVFDAAERRLTFTGWGA